MNTLYDPNERPGVAEARESFSGKLLTDTQFDNFMDVTKIIERGISAKGAFKETLRYFADATSRLDNIKPERAENIIRDFFKARTGLTMNEMRKQLESNFESLTEAQKSTATPCANDIRQMVESGNKITFNRALTHQAASLATSLNITDSAAQTLIKDSFEARNEQGFYDWGKELDGQNYKIQVQTEKQERKATQSQSRSFTRSR